MIMVFAVACTAVEAATYVPGLLFGEVSAYNDLLTPNPGTSIDPLGPSMSEVTTKPPWADLTTYIYTGQFYEDDGLVCFYERIDDTAWLKVGGNVVLNDTGWNIATSSGLINLPVGWNDFELRISNFGSSAGPVGPLGFGYDPTGAAGTSTNYEDYIHPQNSSQTTADVFRTVPEPATLGLLLLGGLALLKRRRSS